MGALRCNIRLFPVLAVVIGLICGSALAQTDPTRELTDAEKEKAALNKKARKAVDRGYNRDELPEEEKNKTEIHVAKHRNGPTGKIDLFFDEDMVSFKNIEKISREEPPPEF